MSTLEQLPIKKGRGRKTEVIPEQPGILAALESAKEVKKRASRKKAIETPIEEAPVKVLTKERKKRLTKEAISERVEKKRKLSKSLERKQEDAPLENEEAFRGENGSTIFTGPENLPTEDISTTESVDYQPNIDDMGFDDIIGSNVEKETIPLTKLAREEQYGETPAGANQERVVRFEDLKERGHDFSKERFRYNKGYDRETYTSEVDELTPEELYAPLLPKDTARDNIKLNQSEYYDKPGQSFDDKPTSVLKRFWNWVSRKNPDMYAAHEYYDYNHKEESAKHNKNKKQTWFEEYNQYKSNAGYDREAINKFVDSQNRNAVARDIEDYNEVEDRQKEEREFDHALNEFKDHLDEEERLYNARMAAQALEEKKMLEAWGPYLKERAHEESVQQLVNNLEVKNFVEANLPDLKKKRGALTHTESADRSN